MAHKWPSIYDLSLGQHLVWKFLWKDDDHIKLMVKTPQPLYNELLLNIRYAPINLTKIAYMKASKRWITIG
jgi:hypothetical protein